MEIDAYYYLQMPWYKKAFYSIGKFLGLVKLDYCNIAWCEGELEVFGTDVTFEPTDEMFRMDEDGNLIFPKSMGGTKVTAEEAHRFFRENLE